MAPLLLPLQGLTAQGLADAAAGHCSLAEARKVLSAVHRRGEALPARLDGCTNAALAAVRSAVAVPRLKLLARSASRVDPFVKFLFELDSGEAVEAVRIPLEQPGRYCVCVSSQAGCAMGCAYCATGRLGLLRSLNAWEIVEQVRTVHLDLRAESASAAAAAGSDAASLGSPSPRSAEEAEQRRRRPGPGPRVHGVVFQGMGEPTNNLGAVLQAIAVLCEPSAQQVSASNVTVSTVGSSPDGIRALAAAAPRCRLALSVGSARPAVRGAIMPSERRHPLWGPVLDACVHHAVATGLQPLWAVTPLAGVNDTEADALALADLAREFERRTDGVRPRISIVPYNSTVPSAAAAAAGAGFGEGGGGGGAGDSTAAAPEVDPFSRTAPAAEAAFRNALRARGVFSHRRYSGGGDVGAACGQLAGAVSAGRALAGAGAAAAAGAEGGGGAGGEVVQSNWAGDWRGGVRDSGRPTLEGAYS